MSENELNKTFLEVNEIQKQFLEDYYNQDNVSLKQWLASKLKSQLPENQNDYSEEIIESLTITEQKYAELQAAKKSGKTREAWFANELEKYSSFFATGEINTSFYQGIDDALKKANIDMINCCHKYDGSINQNNNLDGLIAEYWHANTHNINAAAQGSKEVATVLGSNELNSVDIQVQKKTGGEIIQNVQSKYGKDAGATRRYLKEGNYEGQESLIPAEQSEQFTEWGEDHITTVGKKVQSTELTKEQAKELQEHAQNGEDIQFDWNDIKVKDVAKGIAKNAGKSALMGVAIGAGSYLVEKIVKKEEIKGKELLQKSLTSGVDFGVKAAIAGALKTAVEKGVLKKILPPGTPAATCANIAFVAVENVKVAYKVSKGEYTVSEGIEKAAEVTVSTIAGLAAGAVGKKWGTAAGAKLGAMIGTTCGPVGAAVGGFIGGAVGYMAGSAVGQAAAKGVSKLVHKGIDYLMSKAIERKAKKQTSSQKQSQRVVAYAGSGTKTSSVGGHSSSSGKKGGCFITTATCQSKKLPDDCYELTCLRYFRDTYMQQNSQMKSEVEEYYSIAPLICEKINAQENSTILYDDIWEKWLKKAVKAISNNENAEAYSIYKEMFLTLKYTYLEEDL
ncbi:MAG: glycine zipper family protein [Treponema sp.]|uniref:glycine zipper family protein n=1 Tax=Treponema sp. TaxID=166 RepID=UPI002A91DDC6|nr:glycine zipper family protein [Treponema sp.]MDY6397777.1 glycine zipper family protein [Treponema sp.]